MDQQSDKDVNEEEDQDTNGQGDNDTDGQDDMGRHGPYVAAFAFHGDAGSWRAQYVVVEACFCALPCARDWCG